MESLTGAAHSHGDDAPDRAASHAGLGSCRTPACPHQPGGEEAAAGAGPVPTAACTDERTLTLIRRYARPDHRGWVMDPTDMHYRLTRWHGVQIIRDQVTEVLQTGAYAAG